MEKNKKMRWFLMISVVLCTFVLGFMFYVYDTLDYLSANILGATEEAPRVERVAGVKRVEGPYDKVQILDYSVEGGAVKFEVEDQGIGYPHSYVIECVNGEDVYMERYSVPVLEIYNLHEDEAYACRAGIYVEGEVLNKSEVVNIETEASPYEKVVIVGEASSTHSITLRVEDMIIDYKDRYVASCKKNDGSRVIYEGMADVPEIEVQELEKDTEYKCSVAIERGEYQVNRSEAVDVRTKMDVNVAEVGETEVVMEMLEYNLQYGEYFAGECVSEENELYSGYGESKNSRVKVSGLNLNTEYKCKVSLKNGEDVLGDTEMKEVKTLESLYGVMKIIDYYAGTDMVELKIEDKKISRQYSYAAECIDKENSEFVYTASSVSPVLRVYGLMEGRTYECTVGVDMGTRIAGKSEIKEIETREVSAMFEDEE